MAAFSCLAFISLLSSCLASRYAMFPSFGRSHYLAIAKIGGEIKDSFKRLLPLPDIHSTSVERRRAKVTNKSWMKCSNRFDPTQLLLEKKESRMKLGRKFDQIQT